MRKQLERELIAFARRCSESDTIPAVFIRTNYTNLHRELKSSDLPEITKRITAEDIERFQQEIRDTLGLLKSHHAIAPKAGAHGIVGLLDQTRAWQAMGILYLQSAWHDWEPYFPRDVDILDTLDRIGAPTESDFRFADICINKALAQTNPDFSEKIERSFLDDGTELIITVAPDPDLNLARASVLEEARRSKGLEEANRRKSEKIQDSEEFVFGSFEILHRQMGRDLKTISKMITKDLTDAEFAEWFGNLKRETVRKKFDAWRKNQQP